MDISSDITLGHWDVRGAGQPIRNLLAYLRIPYKEIKYPDEDSWFKIDKPKLNSSFPNLPYLIHESKIITESHAILVYIALKFNREDLIGETPMEKIYFAQIKGVWADIRNKLYEIAMDKKSANITKLFKENLNPHLQLIDNHLNGKDFICGKLTVMDFVILEGLEWLNIQDGELLKDFVNFKTYMKNIKDLPGVKEYENSGNLPKYFLWSSYANPNLKIAF